MDTFEARVECRVNKLTLTRVIVLNMQCTLLHCIHVNMICRHPQGSYNLFVSCNFFTTEKWTVIGPFLIKKYIYSVKNCALPSPGQGQLFARDSVWASKVSMVGLPAVSTQSHDS